MKMPVSISLDKKQVEQLDEDPMRENIGRSGLIRLALAEYYLRRKDSEKENKEDENKE